MFSSSYSYQITEPGFVIVPGRKGKGYWARADVCPPSISQAAESPSRSGVSTESLPCGLRLPLAFPLWQEAGPLPVSIRAPLGTAGGWRVGRKVTEGGTVLPLGSKSFLVLAEHVCTFTGSRATSQLAYARILAKSPDPAEPQSPFCTEWGDWCYLFSLLWERNEMVPVKYPHHACLSALYKYILMVIVHWLGADHTSLDHLATYR